MVSSSAPCPLSFLFLIGSTMFGFLYSDSNFSFFLQSLVIQSFIGPKILLRIFLSKTTSLLLSVFRVIQVSAIYVTTGHTMVVYNYFLSPLTEIELLTASLVQKSIFSSMDSCFYFFFYFIVSVRIVPSYSN